MLKWFVSTRLWIWIASQIVAKLNFRLIGYPTFPMEDYYKINVLIQSRSPTSLLCFVARDRLSLSTKLIRLVSKAIWPHAGVILPLSQDSSWRSIACHMESPGLLEESILEILRRSDDFALLEFPMKEEEYAECMCRLSQIREEKPGYDFAFDIDNQKCIYCSELFYSLTCHTGRLQTHMEKGRKVFEPDDVYNVCRILYEYRQK